MKPTPLVATLIIFLGLFAGTVAVNGVWDYVVNNWTTAELFLYWRHLQGGAYITFGAVQIGHYFWRWKNGTV